MAEGEQHLHQQFLGQLLHVHAVVVVLVVVVGAREMKARGVMF
jgi:hypothetical protein